MEKYFWFLKKEGIRMKGIKIIYKNKEVDYYSPCNKIIIDNDHYQYNIQVDKIESIETYEEEE